MTINLYPPAGTTVNPVLVSFAGSTQQDAFGRLRVSNPYTMFDSQSRYAADNEYSYYTATGGTSAFNTNRSSVNLNVTTTSGSTTVAQTYRVFPYQPGKSLLTMQTFTMAPAQTNLTQRIGYYNVNNGVYLEQTGDSTYPLYFTIRTYTSGAVNNARSVQQPNWNVDKFDGTGPSGIVLDITKTQILWLDLEWLGVGTVRCGFVVDGILYIAHVFDNANSETSVYMQTAILPLRCEIFTTGTTASAASLQQICSTVISEGGYDQTSQLYNAYRTTPFTIAAAATFYPLVSIRLNSSYLGAVVLPAFINFLPVSGTNTYEVVLIKNASLTGATWASTLSAGQVDVDVAATAFATAPSGDSIILMSYAVSTNQGVTPVSATPGYNWSMQLGVTANPSAPVSDTYTLGVRGASSAGLPTVVGAIAFYNLTV